MITEPGRRRTMMWTEGAPGTGYGESLYMETDPYTVITGGVICTGYYASEDLFYKNAAPTRIYIQTGNQEAYLDVTEYANTYYSGFEGIISGLMSRSSAPGR